MFWLLFSTASYADVYIYQDKNGTTHFATEKKGPQWKWFMRTPKPSAGQSSIVRSSNSQNQRKQLLSEVISSAAYKYRLDPALIHAVIEVESNYKDDAVSHAGAMGLMQLMPATAERFSVSDPFIAADNVDAGSRYLRWLLDEFNSLPLALAGYNAGEGAVRRYGDIPPYKETQHYVTKVIERYKRNLQM
ncbi:lytic transglycosylase domain-containing protein [Alginatibacterium sediminis]|uniref:Lytic transglycosylase domain-containing protein n=1 Tax=Alginatibacterium sediminis TaxID=2164068 RepID=A0A420EAY7_9ALTE|nr:transglycosylase SLT domain-containing protein [Alginatibacterium sediminis]RKF17845.1 lytic transglycosylase domain-containing protein [Alginatibacterium sediminis]